MNIVNGAPFPNLLSVESLEKKFSFAELHVERHIPISPKYNSGIFSMMSSLWHINRRECEELGNAIFLVFSVNPDFPSGPRQVLSGSLDMETDWQDRSRAVFLCQKPSQR